MIKPSFTLLRFTLPGIGGVEVTLDAKGQPDSVSTEGFKEPLSAESIEKIAALLREQRALESDRRDCCALHGYHTTFHCSTCITEREQQEAREAQT